jgi:hypothetical protein
MVARLPGFSFFVVWKLFVVYVRLAWLSVISLSTEFNGFYNDSIMLRLWAVSYHVSMIFSQRRWSFAESIHSSSGASFETWSSRASCCVSIIVLRRDVCGRPLFRGLLTHAASSCRGSLFIGIRASLPIHLSCRRCVRIKISGTFVLSHIVVFVILCSSTSNMLMFRIFLRLRW